MSKDIWVLIEHLRGEILEISYTMLAAGRELCDGLGGELTAVLLGKDARGLAGTLGVADRVRYVDHKELSEFNPEAYLATLAPMIKESPPRLVMFGHTSIGMDVACGVAQQVEAPIASSCRTLKLEGDKLRYQSLTCGGKLVAEGGLPEPVCVITLIAGGYKPETGMAKKEPPIEDVAPPVALDELRTRLKQYIEPEEGDVDVTKESVLVSVGRGIQQEENLRLAEELASALGGAVCSSRPVVDWGWLPTSRLIGKSGKSVKPKLYLALGISGAPEHTEGMRDADFIVAINTDERAPIFDIAQLGAAVDVLELIPALTAKVREATGG